GQSWIRRWSGFFFFAIALSAVWYSQSRGALLALAAQIAGYYLTTAVLKKRIWAWVPIGLVACGYLFFLTLIKRDVAAMEASSQSRIAYWRAAGNMALHNPFFGVGFDQFPERYEAYAPSLIFESGRRAAHSSWLLPFAESGIIGGLLFAAFFVIVLQTAW